MLLKSQKNVSYMVVANESPQTTGTIHTSALTAGQWGVVGENGFILGSGSYTNDKIRIAYNRAGQILLSPTLNSAYLNGAAVVGRDTAFAEQISYIGYVGSGTETIEAIDNNDYVIRILLRGIQAIYGDKMMYKFGAYRSSNSATELEVALGLASNLTTNFKREKIINKEQKIKFEVLTSTANTVAAMDNTCGVVNGEANILFATAASYSAGTLLAVGDFLRFDTPAGGAPAVTDGVYKIIAVNGLVLTLDRPYEGTTNTAYGVADVAVITAVNAVAGTVWGIKCTGIARTNFREGVFNYERVRFDLSLEDCGTTLVTNSTTPTEGIGWESEVREMEYFFYGNCTDGLRLGVPPPIFNTLVTSSYYYNYIVLGFKDQSYDAINGTPKSPYSIVLACRGNTTVGTHTIYDAVKVVLDRWDATGVPSTVVPAY